MDYRVNSDGAGLTETGLQMGVSLSLPMTVISLQ